MPNLLESNRDEEMNKYYQKYKQEKGFVLCFLREEDNEKILICFMQSNKNVDESDIVTIVKKMKKMDIKKGLLVSNTRLVASGEKIIRYVNAESDLCIEFFEMNDLLINNTKHELVPKHILCTQKEKQIVMKKYRVKESQLPKLLASDPMARYLGLKKGDLVKIIRKSETAGMYVVYRVVV